MFIEGEVKVEAKAKAKVEVKVEGYSFLVSRFSLFVGKTREYKTNQLIVICFLKYTINEF